MFTRPESEKKAGEKLFGGGCRVQVWGWWLLPAYGTEAPSAAGFARLLEALLSLRMLLGTEPPVRESSHVVNEN